MIRVTEFVDRLNLPAQLNIGMMEYKIISYE